MSSKRRYGRPFETYRLGPLKPSEIELARKGLATYGELATNPLYYESAIKFMGGELYRAALGYDVIWDKRAEADLMLALDFVLTDYGEKKLYYLEEIRVTRDNLIHGVSWPRGVAPRKLTFDLQWPFELKAGESLTARINLLDKPNHIDLERATGEVFTVSYLRYQNQFNTGAFKRKGSHETHHQSRYKPASPSTKDGARKGRQMALRACRENATGETSSQLLYLRKAF